MLRLNKKVWSNLRSFLIVWERRTGEVRGCSFRLKRTKLNYRFYNPNSAEDTADFLLIEANAGKVERAMEEAVSQWAEDSEYIAESEETEKVEEIGSIRRKRA